MIADKRNGKAEQKERDKLTLRISPALNQRTKERSEYLGISQNALLLMLIDLGLR